MRTEKNDTLNVIGMRTRRCVVTGVLAIGLMAGTTLAAQAQCGPLCALEGLLKSNDLAAGSGGGTATANSNGNSFDVFGSSGLGKSFSQPSFGHSQPGGGPTGGTAGISGAIGDIGSSIGSIGSF